MISLTVTTPTEFQELIHNMSLILMFKGQYNVVYDWTRLPESLQRTVQTHVCWRSLHEKFAKSGLIEVDGLTSRGTVQERLAAPEPRDAPDFDFFSPSELDEVISAKPSSSPAVSTSSRDSTGKIGAKLTKVPSSEKKTPPMVTTTSTSPRLDKHPSRCRLNQRDLDRYVRDATSHIRTHGGNPPMLASATNKVLTKATNYIRDQMNLRHLDEASLEAIVVRLEQLGVGRES